MNYTEGAAALSDDTFMLKVRIGLAKVCTDIANEDPETANHDLRVAHVGACLGNLQEASDMFCALIVTNPAMSATPDDGDIYNCIVAAFPVAAGVHT